ncbi:transglycosylase SLT domain-containing protein [Streptomyces sp. H10-C2]|uniref:transglycosylase SLT domain-containing protein n=1 Tax=unclassified Streptomyces TaxID=2593676 RepID=UPI0024BA86BE|nr:MULTISPECIES: transglycosylase SLT domain-containing protein [unclassified Streptomyces]MDJ0344872.1 transglycosylase SLT domain-containing protein [Streptomyces sp. PH10-H1]MDJ0371932.1 transglycosylase SLT domain-containing protein [Streptomyces sp. H10-C2]
MQLPTLPKLGRLSKVHTFAVAGTATAALTVLAITAGAQGSSGTALASGEPANFAVVNTAGPNQGISAQAGAASQHAAADAAAKKKASDDAAAAAKKKAADDAAKKKASDDAAKKKASDEAAKRQQETQAANRSTQRKAVSAAPAPAPAPAAPAAASYSNNLDGWIKQSLSIMSAKGIPGSYDGIHRNIMRESSGNPQAINLTDSNAAAGIPSKGLLQVIDPTFAAYHVAGTSNDIYDPVANITAACNYAAANYGSIDNVNSAY